MTFYHTNNSIKIPESGNYNTRFSQYITGLLEGDGTIHVPKTLRSVKGTLNYPSFFFLCLNKFKLLIFFFCASVLK